jgi:hypothetical protein
MVTGSRRFLREPKSVDDFSKFGNKLSLLDGIDCLGIASDKQKFYHKEFIDEVCRKIKMYEGKKVHFLLPMTGQQGTGEYLKGLLHVMFPKTDVSFSFLKTPYRVNINLAEDMPDTFGRYDAILGENIQACLNAHGTSSSDTEFIIVDRYGSGTTKRAINRHLGVLADFIDPANFGSGLEDSEFHLTQDKSQDGEMSPSRGHLLNLVLTQEPENPKVKKDEFTRNGYTLINWLKSNADRCFTPDEKRSIEDSDYDLYDRARATKDGWPNIIAHIRALPQDRQRSIIKRLIREDNMVARMAYQYGIAHAKDYLKEHGQKTQ